MKKELKIWLEEDEIRRLKLKASAQGFNGKGFLSHYISRICNETIAFIPKDVEVILKLKK